MNRKTLARLEYIQTTMYIAATELKGLQYDSDLSEDQKAMVRRAELAIDHDAYDLRPLVESIRAEVGSERKLLGFKLP